MQQAAALGLGVCPIGILEAGTLAALGPGAEREVVHSFVGGWPADVASAETDALPHSAHALADALAAWCAQALPDYMVPAAFVTLDALPLTANGKVDRARLPLPATRSHGTESPPPDGPLEAAVAAVFAEVLGQAGVARDDVIFDLGGTSVHVVRIHRRLEERLARTIDIVDVFRYPSVRALAAHLAAHGPAPSAGDGAARGLARRGARTVRGGSRP
jgi:hypothetical protein